CREERSLPAADPYLGRAARNEERGRVSNALGEVVILPAVTAVRADVEAGPAPRRHHRRRRLQWNVSRRSGACESHPEECGRPPQYAFDVHAGVHAAPRLPTDPPQSPLTSISTETPRGRLSCAHHTASKKGGSQVRHLARSNLCERSCKIDLFVRSRLGNAALQAAFRSTPLGKSMGCDSEGPAQA